MSGLAEIKQWVNDNISSLGISEFSNVDDAYDRINNPRKEDWRNDLDDILLDQKPEFLDFLETQISQPFEPPEPIEQDNFITSFLGNLTNFISSFLGISPEPEPTDFINIRAFSYIRNGKVINVRAHTRRKRK